MKKFPNKTNDMSSKKNLEIEDPLDDEDISANSPPHKPPQKEVTIYDLMDSAMKSAFNVNVEEENENDGLEGAQYRKALIKAYLHDNKKTILCGAGFFLVAANCMLLLGKILAGITGITTSCVSSNLIYYMFASLFPYLLWMISTDQEYWNFHNRKMRTFTFCCFNAVLCLCSIVFRISGTFSIPFFAGLTPTIALNEERIRAFARLVLLLTPTITCTLMMTAICKNLYSPIIKTSLIRFKFDTQFDLRSSKEKEFAYDMSIVKDLETGEQKNIKERDRFLHAVANGTTGTGKTSSCFTCAIQSDIDQIVYNLEYQKKKVMEYLEKGQIHMKVPMRDCDFTVDNFVPDVPKDEKLLYNLKFKAPIAGITAMAPNASFSDEIYDLARAKGLKVNRVDPTLGKDGKLKEGFKGFNPLYMKPGLPIMEQIIKRNEIAVLFADVAQAVYDASGQSDVYFAGLNKNVTTSVTMLVLLTFEFLPESEKAGRSQPDPTDVQNILNNFQKAENLKKIFVEHYAKRDKNGNYNRMNPDMGIYQPIYDFIEKDLLGDGADQLFEQCRGLRNIINSFLQNPLIKNILCTQNSICLDDALENGEITLVNYALELGSDSTVFGLFFMLSMINAVYRRPGGEIKKLPHFFYIDELPVLLHPRIEGCFSLFRQFRVAMFVAVQSLAQMEKSNSTAFLKDVLLGNCAHHFVFGRAAAQEMELYESIAGMSLQVTHMEGERGTSVFSDNPNLSYDRRDTIEEKSNITGTDVRYRNFQEVTVVTVDNGSAVDAFLGKVSFLPSYRRLKKKRFSVDWSAYPALKAAGTENLHTLSADMVEEDSPVSIRSEIGSDTFHSDSFNNGDSSMKKKNLFGIVKADSTDNAGSHENSPSSISDKGKYDSSESRGKTFMFSSGGHAPDKENAPPSDIFPETENKDVEDIDSYDSDDLTIEIIDQILNSTGTLQEDETQENTFTPIEQEKIVSLAANDVSDTTAAGINTHEENTSVVGGTLAPRPITLESAQKHTKTPLFVNNDAGVTANSVEKNESLQASLVNTEVSDVSSSISTAKEVSATDNYSKSEIFLSSDKGKNSKEKTDADTSDKKKSKRRKPKSSRHTAVEGQSTLFNENGDKKEPIKTKTYNGYTNI